MKIVLHNQVKVVDVIGGCRYITAHGNRVKWEGGDICAPFFLVSEEVDVYPGDDVASVADHCQQQEWQQPHPMLIQELLQRVKALEGED